MPQRPEHGKKQPLLLIAAATCFLATLWAGAWCWAEILAIGPRQQIQHWETQGLTDNPEAFEQAMARLATASQINSSNAEFYWLQGRLAALQQSTVNNNDSPQAISLFKQAIEKRPSWGLPWVYLAQAASKEPDNQSLFIVALQKAAKLEPYEKLNQTKIIPLALANWSRVPNNLKSTLNKIIAHGLKYNNGGNFILEAAAQFNKAEVVEPLIIKEWQKRRLTQLIKQRTDQP
ncbi:MAG: hypothetical protein JKY52_08680 [Flavobacteriales bacterium]|nr:hypothetical protein [Flavobacteriales bacterium]